MLDVFQVEGLLARESEDAAGCADDDVWTVCLEDRLVLLDGHAPEEHSDLDVVHVLAEALILLADLERQLSRVAQHKHRHLQVQDRPHQSTLSYDSTATEHSALLLLVYGAQSSI